MKMLFALISFLSILFSANIAMTEPLRVFVSDFNAVGVQNKDEMKSTLQMLLSSRMSSDKVIAVGSQAEADVLVSGTYIAIGKIFSIDALVRSIAGKTLTRVYVQGDSGEELIPAIGKLAEKLLVVLAQKADSKNTIGKTGAADTLLPAVRSDIVKPVQPQKQVASDFIKSKEMEQASAGAWVSRRLEGAFNLMAIGSKFHDGGRELFMAEDRKLVFYRQTNEMKLVSEVEFRTTEKIIGLDAIDEGNSITTVYVTIMRGDDLASQVWHVKDGKFVKIADDLPWLFRALSIAGSQKKLYAQAMGRDADFYGDVYEVSRNGNTITTKKTIKMPRYGNLYTFNQFSDKDGKVYTVVLNSDGYMIVYDQALNELWRSNDKFGGSELFFLKEDLVNILQNGGKYRWVFLNQRIQVTAKGEVLVGKNEGFWVLGNARSYKKGAIYCMQWNGSSLEEKWRTRETQNYMPDFYIDEDKNELLILQTVQRAGSNTIGASSLSIKKVE